LGALGEADIGHFFPNTDPRWRGAPSKVFLEESSRQVTRSLKFGFPIARTLGNCLSAATLARLVGLMGEAGVIDLIYTSRLIEAE
jgi:hypothetical protein